MIREDIFLKLIVKELSPSSIALTGFANAQIEKKGYFLATELIDGEEFKIKMHVVSMQLSATIGLDFIMQVEMTGNKSGVTLNKNQLNILFNKFNIQQTNVEDEVNIEETVEIETYR